MMGSGVGEGGSSGTRPPSLRHEQQKLVTMRKQETARTMKRSRLVSS